MGWVKDKVNNLLDIKTLKFDCLYNIQLPLRILYYTTDLMLCTNPDLTKGLGIYNTYPSNKEAVPENNIIEELISTLKGKGYKLDSDSLVYGDCYLKISEYKDNFDKILSTDSTHKDNWTTKTWIADSLNTQSSQDSTVDLEERSDEGFEEFMSILNDITSSTTTTNS